MPKIKLKSKSKLPLKPTAPSLIRKPEPQKKLPKKTFHAAEGDVADKYETRQVNIRLPENVLDYYRDNFSPGYQTKIKEILSDYMEANPK